MLKIFFFLIVAIVALVFESKGKNLKATKWDELRTTWSAIPIAGYKGFFSVPTTVSSAIKNKWEQLLACGDETSPGNVYWLNGDLSSMPFYNANGDITGIILGMWNPGETSEVAPFNKYKMQNGSVFWGVEANFRNPALACKVTNNDTNTIGDRLWFADGNHSSYYEAPLIENTTHLNSEGWIKGKCFVAMGTHYWRYMEVDMNCNYTYPIFLLYNSGVLNAWGIAMAHSDRPYLTSYRWEHPSGSELNYFFQSNTMPTCLPNQGTLSTQHVYMTFPLYDDCL